MTGRNGAPAEDDLGRFRRFTGSLRAGGQTLPLRFKARVRGNGELEIVLHAFRVTARTRFVRDLWHNDGPRFAEYRLEGKSEDGFRFQTDDLIFLSLGERWSGRTNWHASKPRGECGKATLTRDLARPVETTFLELRLKGFECVQPLRTVSALGPVTAAGATRLKEPDRLAGLIRVEASSAPDDTSGWRRDADALLEHVRRILSFGAGTALRAPVLQFAHGRTLEIEVVSQSRQQPSEMRVFHKLDQQALLDAAVTSWADPPIPRSKLELAFEWFAMTSLYNEVRLVNAMTALEHLVDANLTEAEAMVLPRAAFRHLQRRLRLMVEEQITDLGSAEAVEGMTDKLVDLNRRPFRRKLVMLAAKWGVPLDDIGEKRIKGAINARNSVVHRGQLLPGSSDEDLWQHMTVTREIVVRFLLTAIGFRGSYLSHIGGWRQASFPPPAA